MLHELDAVEGLVRSGRLKVWPDRSATETEPSNREAESPQERQAEDGRVQIGPTDI